LRQAAKVLAIPSAKLVTVSAVTTFAVLDMVSGRGGTAKSSDIACARMARLSGTGPSASVQARQPSGGGNLGHWRDSSGPKPNGMAGSPEQDSAVELTSWGLTRLADAIWYTAVRRVKPQKKTRIVNVKLTESQYAAIEQRAERRGVRVSVWMRSILMQVASSRTPNDGAIRVREPDGALN
jgi:hypothetical protein